MITPQSDAANGGSSQPQPQLNLHEGYEPTDTVVSVRGSGWIFPKRHLGSQPVSSNTKGPACRPAPSFVHSMLSCSLRCFRSPHRRSSCPPGAS